MNFSMHKFDKKKKKKKEREISFRILDVTSNDDPTTTRRWSCSQIYRPLSFDSEKGSRFRLGWTTSGLQGIDVALPTPRRV